MGLAKYLPKGGQWPCVMMAPSGWATSPKTPPPGTSCGEPATKSTRDASLSPTAANCAVDKSRSRPTSYGLVTYEPGQKKSVRQDKRPSQSWRLTLADGAKLLLRGDNLVCLLRKKIVVRFGGVKAGISQVICAFLEKLYRYFSGLLSEGPVALIVLDVFAKHHPIEVGLSASVSLRHFCRDILDARGFHPVKGADNRICHGLYCVRIIFLKFTRRIKHTRYCFPAIGLDGAL